MIGIYGGTFDPIHFGHLNLAIEMLETHHLEAIWFCPVWISPHKQKQQPVSAKMRLEMVKLALEGVPHCKVLDVEVNRGGPSYTVETLRSLNELFPNQKFCLILGDDALPSFLRWHQPEEIVQRVPIFIGRRSSAPVSLDAVAGHPEIYHAIKRGLTETKVIDISSTEIRKRLSMGLYCGHLVPAKVLDYIYAHRLYSIPVSS